MKLNDQPVKPEVVELASDEEGLDTAVVSFFDVDYVRTDERNVFSSGALDRSEQRRQQSPPFLKR